MKKLLSKPIFNSRIQSPTVTKKEQWLGYLLGPGGVLLLNAVISGYLNTYYTDVLKVGTLMGGAFLVIMPIVSKIIDAVTNILMGQIIDRTKTAQGKARPWLLVAAPAVVVSAMLLVLVPRSSELVQVIWLTLSYNLYYCFAYTIYNMSHTLLMPLSTSNTKERDKLAMFSNVGNCVIPGMFVSMLFPMLVRPWMGVNGGRWILVFGVCSAIVLPAILLEYYFTKERITENENEHHLEQPKTLPMRVQLKACLNSKYWVMAMSMLVVGALLNGIVIVGRIYYCDWVLGTYNDGLTYTILNAVGQFPLGIGIFLVWPLVGKFGKRNCILVGSVLAVIGGLVSLYAPRNLIVVLAGLVVASFGVLPNTYTGTALMADAMDYVEYRHGFRCDGLTASIYSIVTTISAGIGTGIVNMGLAAFNYVPPAADGSWNPQSQELQTLLIVMALGLAVVGPLVNVIALLPYKLDKEMPKIRMEMEARKAAEK